eukprot:3350663-Rhodomonas_salina.9
MAVPGPVRSPLCAQVRLLSHFPTPPDLCLDLSKRLIKLFFTIAFHIAHGKCGPGPRSEQVVRGMGALKLTRCNSQLDKCGFEMASLGGMHYAAWIQSRASSRDRPVDMRFSSNLDRR